MKRKPKIVPVFRPYQGFKLEDIATRPKSLDILKFPSKVANTLFYPDGRIVNEQQANR